jgi:molybdopterin biosynthesis enzyme MoaB
LGVAVRCVLGRTVPGFGEVWEMLTPVECKCHAVLSAQQLQALKSDLDIMAGKLL